MAEDRTERDKYDRTNQAHQTHSAPEQSSTPWLRNLYQLIELCWRFVRIYIHRRITQRIKSQPGTCRTKLFSRIRPGFSRRLQYSYKRPQPPTFDSTRQPAPSARDCPNCALAVSKL